MKTAWACCYVAILLSVFLPARGQAASAGAPFKDCRDCPEMKMVPAGKFVMGSPTSEEGRRINSGGDGNQLADENRELQHEVVIANSFALGVYPVTRGEYALFVETTRYRPVNECNSSKPGATSRASSTEFTWEDPGFFKQGDNDPAVCISALDALAYLDWLSRTTGKVYRLPSEAEWEYAARAGTTTSRYWGDDPAQGCAYANGIGNEATATFVRGTSTGCNDNFIFPSPVGSFKPNAFGLYDMLGNTWEWVSDCWHNTYEGAPADGSSWGQEPHCKHGVLRGGAFGSNYTSLRSAARHESWPSARSFNHGFRVARDL